MSGCCDNAYGCMVCGEKLLYTPDRRFRVKCHCCGIEAETSVFCMNGHYVCDDCHRQGILDMVEKACCKSELTDPAALLDAVFQLPGMHMHGPEYHSIVPAVLVAAYGNCTGHRDDMAIKEAILRGKDIKGGVCGSHGACGAGIGVGIAYSVIHSVMPYSKADRGIANRMTALALLEISRYGGPRCCKRESMLAVHVAKDHFGGFAVGSCDYTCRQFAYNELCIGSECPYHPSV